MCRPGSRAARFLVRPGQAHSLLELAEVERLSVRLEKSGRILIPVAVRRRLGLKEGESDVLLEIEDDQPVRVSARCIALKQAQARLSGYVKKGRRISEELIAELTAAFLCAHLEIEGELRHAGYIADWIQLLKEDDRAIFTAASKASQAADYLRQFSEAVPAEETELET